MLILWVFSRSTLHFSVGLFFLNLSERQVHLITIIKKDLNRTALTLFFLSENYTFCKRKRVVKNFGCLAFKQQVKDMFIFL